MSTFHMPLLWAATFHPSSRQRLMACNREVAPQRVLAMLQRVFCIACSCLAAHQDVPHLRHVTPLRFPSHRIFCETFCCMYHSGVSLGLRNKWQFKCSVVLPFSCCFPQRFVDLFFLDCETKARKGSTCCCWYRTRVVEKWRCSR